MHNAGLPPIGTTLDEGWRLFLQSLMVIFLPVWVAGIVDVLPDEIAGGGLLTGSLNWSVLAVTVPAWLVEAALYGSAIVRLNAVARGASFLIPRHYVWESVQPQLLLSVIWCTTSHPGEAFCCSSCPA